MASQLERLKQDVRELELYIKKVQKRGKDDLVSKLSKKRKYLTSFIAEYEQQVMQ